MKGDQSLVLSSVRSLAVDKIVGSLLVYGFRQLAPCQVLIRALERSYMSQHYLQHLLQVPDDRRRIWLPT